jgi:hypothetical protein
VVTAANPELANVARRARPTISLLSMAGAIILIGGLAETIAAGYPAGPLAVFLALGVAATPGYLYVRHLQQHVWNNSPRAVAWARLLVVVVSAGAATYASTYLLGRLLDLLAGDGAGPSGFGRVVPFIFALGGAGAMFVIRRKEPVTRLDRHLEV